jgi:metal-responsive CopG/Arc/MetJ family transcriptional regulator
MGHAKIKLDKDLYEKLRKYAELSGYSSADEFIAHLVERELATLEKATTEEEIKKKLKGLGYIS